MIRLRCEYCQQVIADGGRAADHKQTYNEHRAACKPQHKGHQFFKGENTMSNFLEQRRDWQLDQIVKDRDKGKISDAEAQEQILLAHERYDKARRWRDNVA